MSCLLSFIIILSMLIQPYGCKDNKILSYLNLCEQPVFKHSLCQVARTEIKRTASLSAKRFAIDMFMVLKHPCEE